MAKQEKPVAKKPTKSIYNPNELYASALEIPSDLQAELDEQGLVARWINAGEFQRQAGFHRSRWVPYKSQSKVKAGATSLFNGDPEGFIRRGDLILAVKSQEEADLHKARLSAKANNYKDFNKTKARELREMARSQGVDMKVFEGYEANDTEEGEE